MLLLDDAGFTFSRWDTSEEQGILLSMLEEINVYFALILLCAAEYSCQEEMEILIFTYTALITSKGSST